MKRRVSCWLILFACALATLPATQAHAAKKATAKKPAVEKSPPAPETLADLQKKARALMRALDFEAAMPVLSQVAGHSEATAPMKASANIDLGICLVNTGDATAARGAFDRALELDANAAPPDSAPPKVQTLYQSVREARFAPPAPPPLETPPLEMPPLAAAPVAPATDAPRLPPQVEAAPAKKSGGAAVGVGVALAVVAAGGLVAGIVTGLQSQSAATDLRGALHTGAEAQALASKQQTMATLSIVSYAAAGAAAAGAVVALVMGATAKSDVAVAVVATPQGVAASAAVNF